jgi:hypothetical protein
MSFVIFAIAAVIHAFEFIELVPSLAVHLVKVQRLKIRRTRGHAIGPPPFIH